MKTRAALLVLIQCLLVSSIAVKYLYERATRPRVWVRVAQFDPNLPMRGRYLALSPVVDACNLPHDEASSTNSHWQVLVKARDGKLVVEDARDVLPRSQTQAIWLSRGQDCANARLTPGVDFFIPDTAKPPFPLEPGSELWAEVTVPPAGPPRPIQLALSENGQWKPLKLE